LTADAGCRSARCSAGLSGGAPVALIDDARAERPGFDQVERDVLGDRREERRAATDDDRMAEDAQHVDETGIDRRRGQPRATDLDVLISRGEGGGDLLATDLSASRALPSTLSSVRLKTTFRRADQTSANAA
jgi:hypothetical protein